MALTPSEDLERYCRSVNQSSDNDRLFLVQTERSWIELTEKTDHVYRKKDSTPVDDGVRGIAIELLRESSSE